MVNSSSNAFLSTSTDSWEEYRRLQDEANAICSVVQKSQIESDTRIWKRIKDSEFKIRLSPISEELKKNREVVLKILSMK